MIGHRRSLNQVSSQIENILEIVLVALPRNGIVDELVDFRLREAHRSANARVPLVENGQGHQSNAILDISFNDDSSLFSAVKRVDGVADV